MKNDSKVCHPDTTSFLLAVVTAPLPRLLCFVFLGINLLSIPSQAAAGGESAVGQTQSRRAAQRFDILSWIRDQNATRSAQDARYGSVRGGGPLPDIVLQYRTDRAPVLRDGVELGTDTRSFGRIQFLLDDVFTRGNKKQILNVDIGIEGFFAKTSQFAPATASSQVAHNSTEIGGGLIIRPFGRSSQDTGLLVKGGYVDVNQTGLWFNRQSQVNMYAIYAGAEAKLYLMPFLGGFAEYNATIDREIESLGGKWKSFKFSYGAFIEVYLLNLQAYLFSSECSLTLTSSGQNIKETSTGVGLGATLYF